MKSQSSLLALIFVFLFISCSQEQQNTVPEQLAEKFQFASPEELGMSSDSLAKIEAMVMEYVEARKFPGAVTLIAKEGKIIYESELGWSDSLRTEPYRKEHLFRMASMTKPLVSIATMQLVEAGKVKLDDPVSKYIEVFAESTVLTEFNAEDTTWSSKPADTPMTVRQLLTHTAGVPYSWTPEYSAINAKLLIPELNVYHHPWTLEDVMERMAQIPMAHEPGAKWMYGLNTDVLGRVVEVASGQALNDYIRDHITGPLGMDTFDFYFDESFASDLTRLYVPNQEGKFSYWAEEPPHPMYHPDYPVGGAKTYFSGGSGMTGTARDYFLFCQAMLNDGQLGATQLLKAATAKSMHQDQIDTLTYPSGKSRFGFGFDITNGHPLKPDGTYSWGGAFSTTFWIDPTNEIIAIQLRQVFNSPYGNEINGKLQKVVYSALISG